MDIRTIISAVEEHFAWRLQQSGIIENGINIDSEGKLMVTMQDHSLVFNGRLEKDIQTFIDKYISIPNGENWMRDEEYKQNLHGIAVTYKTSMIGEVEHDVFIYFDGVHKGTTESSTLTEYRLAITNLDELAF